MIRKVYTIDNLDCANCAAKLEAKISRLPGIHTATITFATKQLRISAEDPDALLPQIQELANNVEPGVVIAEYCRSHAHKSPSSIHTHSHHEYSSCSCEHHEHSHPHEHGSCSHEHHAHSHPHEHDEAASSINRTTTKSLTENTKTFLEILLGLALFLAGTIMEHTGLLLPAIIILVTGYLILGGKVLLAALRNLTKGHVFDENFLMSLATLGAFAIREWPEAVGVMLFYRIGEFFEHVAVAKSRSQIMDTIDMRPDTVQLVINEEVHTIAAQEAQIGDILLIRPGDRIPLDGIVLEGESRVDTSAITGEPVPVKVGRGEEVISGCVNTSGLLKIRVEKILEESMVTRILDSVENAAASKPKIDRFITRFARIYTPIVVLLALGTAVIPSLFTGNWHYWVYTALSFLVMSCPCALVLSVPLAFFSGIGAGSKKSILFKGGVSLEAMTQVKAVVMDKTGTITKGNFQVQSLLPAGNMAQEKLLALCAGCELSSTHPIGASIVKAAQEKALQIPQPSSVEEIAGYGIRALLPEGEILCGSKKLLEKYGIPLEAAQKSSHQTEVWAAKDGAYIGRILIADTLKSDARFAISSLKRKKLTTVMLTGDGEANAQAIARETGIDQVYARLLPQDKLQRLQQLRETYGPVMFVGDGINDAPVLAGADVGAAMGSGADAAIEAADVVFMTSDMEAIPLSLSIAQATRQISLQNVIFALTIKVIVMLLGLAGYASMWMAVFADTGVAMLCILNSIRILYKK